jgi:AAA+ superfamily predicted ATPase
MSAAQDLPEAFRRARAQAPAVILLDDLDALAPAEAEVGFRYGVWITS